MKSMLISVYESETRVATVLDKQLLHIDIECSERQQKKGNIYRAKISRIEPSLNALFIDYGDLKHGFLPYKEISPEYLKNKGNELSDKLRIGQEVIVQLTKDIRGNKGATFTTYIKLIGCYMILRVNADKSNGISNVIEGESRINLKKIIDELEIPDNMSAIIRTIGKDKRLTDFTYDLNNLLFTWNSILEAKAGTVGIVYRENNVCIRSVRDYLSEDTEEIVTDNEKAYESVKTLMKIFKPKLLSRLRYKQVNDLFKEYGIDKQVDNIFLRQISLPSGGSIVIDTTEALTAIDVNSSKSTQNINIEETALQTNLEAASEIARQMRARDMSGIIIVDFIDMMSIENQKKLEDQLIEEISLDTARIQVSRLSKLGIVEISRQHLKTPLRESVMDRCPRCHGTGREKSISSFKQSVFKAIEDNATQNKTGHLYVYMPFDCANSILNESKQEIYNLEQKYNIELYITTDIYMIAPSFYISQKPSLKKEKQFQSKARATTSQDNDPVMNIRAIQEEEKRESFFPSKLFEMMERFVSSIRKSISQFFRSSPSIKKNYKKPNKTKVHKSAEILIDRLEAETMQQADNLNFKKTIKEEKPLNASTKTLNPSTKTVDNKKTEHSLEKPKRKDDVEPTSKKIDKHPKGSNSVIAKIKGSLKDFIQIETVERSKKNVRKAYASIDNNLQFESYAS